MRHSPSVKSVTPRGSTKGAGRGNSQLYRYRLRLRGTGKSGDPSAQRRQAGGSAGGGAADCPAAGELPVVGSEEPITSARRPASCLPQALMDRWPPL